MIGWCSPPGGFSFFLLLFRAVFLLFSYVFSISGRLPCSSPAGYAEQAAARVRYALFTYFFLFSQTTGGVDKLLHVAVADVLKTGYGRLLRIATRHMYVNFANKHCLFRTGLLHREFTQGGGVRGVSPRNINQAYTFPRLAKRDAYRALARAALLASIAYSSGERSEPDIFLNARESTYNAGSGYKNLGSLLGTAVSRG